MAANMLLPVKVDSIFFRQNSISSNRQFNARKVLQFINGTENVETKELEINDENNKVNHLYEIKKSGKYIDRFRMLIIPDKEEDELSLGEFDMILETEKSTISIIRNPKPQNIGETRSYDFLRTSTDFEYVKLYFVNTDLFTSIDIHKSQQDKKFIIFSSIIESEKVSGIYTYTCMIKINIKKLKFSPHLNKINDSKEETSIVTVEVTIPKSIVIYPGEVFEIDFLNKKLSIFCFIRSSLDLITLKMELEIRQQHMIEKQAELKEKLKHFNKCRKTWSRIDSVFKTLSVVLTVGTTVATAITGKIILHKDNFKEIKRSRVGRGTELLKKINEYKGRNCYIPTNGNCFIKCVNHVLNKDLTNEFKNFIINFPKVNRKGVMTTARINEFNKKCETSFQIYTLKNRNLRPRDVKRELDWVYYLHNSHFCLIRRNEKSLGIKEIN
ncbi:hypothetical protein LOTGIDRAFT_162007 [Lottia gigantea]|uniref:Uncharacterized protein n=1 Tax=Lottia gigantea TaxID=225164 RepID=V4AHV8_LOTGI|nr:hypothetical protein LOTGIDRAFT_162007 [Lottia gigantea]ESO92981.1 hypothetical protein LOTGIDRAFT_162007 [Lottia gigantea]